MRLQANTKRVIPGQPAGWAKALRVCNAMSYIPAVVKATDWETPWRKSLTDIERIELTLETARHAHDLTAYRCNVATNNLSNLPSAGGVPTRPEWGKAWVDPNLTRWDGMVSSVAHSNPLALEILTNQTAMARNLAKYSCGDRELCTLGPPGAKLLSDLTCMTLGRHGEVHWFTSATKPLQVDEAMQDIMRLCQGEDKILDTGVIPRYQVQERGWECRLRPLSSFESFLESMADSNVPRKWERVPEPKGSYTAWESALVEGIRVDPKAPEQPEPSAGKTEKGHPQKPCIGFELGL
jgi:hypothetical protein